MSRDALALVPLPSLGGVEGRCHHKANEVIATGDPDRACVCVDDPPRNTVALVDVPSGRVVAESSLQRAPAPPREGVDLSDPRWRVRVCDYDADGDVRWTLSWIDPATATVLATVERPHLAFQDDIATLDHDTVLIKDTWFRREGAKLVEVRPLAKAVDGSTAAPVIDRARGVVWFAVAREAGWRQHVTLVRAHIARGTAARRKLELSWAHRIIPSEGESVWVVHHEGMIRVRGSDLAALDRHPFPSDLELVACAAEGSALVFLDFTNERLVTVGETLAPDAPLRGVGDHVARDGSHAFFLRDQVLWRVDLRTGRRQSFQVGHDRRVEAVAFSPRGDHILSADADGRAIVWNLDAPEPRVSFETAPEARGVAFTPDGRGALITSARRATIRERDVDVAETLHAFDLSTQTERASVRLPLLSVGLRCSPDGAWAVPAFGAGRASFAWFDVARGALREIGLPSPPRRDDVRDETGAPPFADRSSPVEWKRHWCAGFAPDGSLVVVHTISGENVHPPFVAITRIDPKAAAVRSTRAMRRPLSLIPGACLSTDGTMVALRLYERLIVVDLEEERAVWHVDCHQGGGWSLWGGRTSLGREVLAYVDEWRGLTVVRLRDGASQRVDEPAAPFTALALSPDEREVAAGLADGRVMRWRVDVE